MIQPHAVRLALRVDGAEEVHALGTWPWLLWLALSVCADGKAMQLPGSIRFCSVARSGATEIERTPGTMGAAPPPVLAYNALGRLARRIHEERWTDPVVLIGSIQEMLSSGHDVTIEACLP